MAQRKGTILWSLWAAALILAQLAALLPLDSRAEAAQPASAAARGGYVALTFDDGPWPETTQALLEGLAQRGVKATFFLIGSQVAGQEDLVRRMAAEGHQVGVHTWDHVQLKGMTPEQIDGQLGKCRACLQEILGPVELMVRPPYGFVDDTLLRCAQAPIICWSVDTEDWKDRNADRIVDTVTDQVRDGSIILMHDIFETSVEAALQCVDLLLAEDYYFVTVEELFALRGVTPEKGQVYLNLPPGTG